jgi:hypothetical protein
MQEILQNQPEPEQRKPLPLNLLLGALVVVGIAVSFWFAFRGPAGSSSRSVQSGVSVPMSQAKQMYGIRIEIENMAIRREENFLHQEVTILDADVINAAGQQSIIGLTFTFEFFDDLHQVVLRETRSVLASPSAPLGPGQRRSISASFDRVPSSWDRQQPSMRVAYLQIETLK